MIAKVQSIKSQWLPTITANTDPLYDPAILALRCQRLNSIFAANATITESRIQCVAFRLMRHLPDIGVGCFLVFRSVGLQHYGGHLILFWRYYIVVNCSSIGNCPNNNVYWINFWLKPLNWIKLRQSHPELIPSDVWWLPGC